MENGLRNAGRMANDSVAREPPPVVRTHVLLSYVTFGGCCYSRNLKVFSDDRRCVGWAVAEWIAYDPGIPIIAGVFFETDDIPNRIQT